MEWGFPANLRKSLNAAALLKAGGGSGESRHNTIGSGGAAGAPAAASLKVKRSSPDFAIAQLNAAKEAEAAREEA
eukprot:4193159-Prymnesium_polylepis.2